MSQYRAGTATVQAGNATVQFTGAVLLGNVSAGDIFSVRGSGVAYQVASAPGGNASLTLTSTYGGANASNVAYMITTSRTPYLGLDYPEAGDVDTATILKTAMLKVEANLLGLSTALQDSITAHAGGGQANATLLTGQKCRITTVATANDSVRLPPATYVGQKVWVMNSAANSANVYPDSAASEQINDGGANAPLAHGGGKMILYEAWSVGKWYALKGG